MLLKFYKCAYFVVKRAILKLILLTPRVNILQLRINRGIRLIALLEDRVKDSTHSLPGKRNL